MLYTIKSVTKKSADWYIVSGIGADGSPLIEASVNRIDRKTNLPFPGFDTIDIGVQIEGEAWTSDKGKQYLFPPRAKKPSNNAAIGKAMEKKMEGIERAQDRREEGVKTAGTMRDAAMIVTALIEAGKLDGEWQVAFQEVRGWLYREWEDTGKYESSPF